MEQTNLAAAIMQWAAAGALPGELELREHLTREDAIKLADWLRRESTINAWRAIYLKPACDAVDSTGPSSNGLPS